MKKLREGYTTGSCATAACLAVAMWKMQGSCPMKVTFTTPIGKTLTLDIVKLDGMRCGVVKDAGDDIDVTDNCMVIADVFIKDKDGEIEFRAGEGVGTVTLKGLKVGVGESAINPVPREMIERELRKIIGSLGAVVTLSIPNGEELAKKTFNGKLGIVGGLSVLGTTGIVRPMSEEAITASMELELKMHYENGKRKVAFVMGNSGEKSLRQIYPSIDCIVHCSNYIGFMLDTAVNIGFSSILIFGQTGKLVKLAADIMNTHSHIADGRNEVICTHASLLGADREIIKKLYECKTTVASLEIIEKYNLHDIWESIIIKAKENCDRRVLGMADIAIIFIDDKNNVLAKTDNALMMVEDFKNE